MLGLRRIKKSCEILLLLKIDFKNLLIRERFFYFHKKLKNKCPLKSFI